MTSSLLESSTTEAPITGAPYRRNDPIVVEVAGLWREATVTQVRPVDKPIFGLRWAITVQVDDSGAGTHTVTCDDQGQNHTYRHMVNPSTRVLS